MVTGTATGGGSTDGVSVDIGKAVVDKSGTAAGVAGIIWLGITGSAGGGAFWMGITSPGKGVTIEVTAGGRGTTAWIAG